MRYPREVGAKIIHLFLFGKDGREKRCVRKTRIFNQIASSTRYAPGRCRHFHSFSDARESSWRRTCSKSPSYDSRVTSKIVKSLKMCFLWMEKTVTVLQNIFGGKFFPFFVWNRWAGHDTLNIPAHAKRRVPLQTSLSWLNLFRLYTA